MHKKNRKVRTLCGINRQNTPSTSIWIMTYMAVGKQTANFGGRGFWFWGFDFENLIMRIWFWEIGILSPYLLSIYFQKVIIKYDLQRPIPVDIKKKIMGAKKKILFHVLNKHNASGFSKRFLAGIALRARRYGFKIKGPTPI